FPNTIMCPVFICSLVLWLLNAGHTDSVVSQIPSHRVTKMGQRRILRCDPISGHAYFYWYQQPQGESLKFMVYLQNANTIDDSGMSKERFSTDFSKDGQSILKIQRAELGDSAVYFCASSLSTSAQSPTLPMHKRPPGSTSETAWAGGREGACLTSKKIS
uniref:Ig-like domain-containing protein n=1 Tax=Neovison vison TaxID=452646 RepID=A0A8C7BZT9_NEOVI